MKTLLNTETTRDELMKMTNIIDLASITGISENKIQSMHSILKSNDEATHENLVDEIIEYLEMHDID